MEHGQNSDFVLSNGALVDYKASVDASGATSISELRIYFPHGTEVPSGGVGARMLREIQFSELLQHWHSNKTESVEKLILTEEQEQELLNILIDFPRNVGKSVTPKLIYSVVAYFYSKLAKEFPRNPSRELARLMGPEPRRISYLVAKARSAGFLTSGSVSPTGGRARGELTSMGRRTIMEHFRRNEDES